MRVVTTEIPWEECSKWKPGFWYPCPFGYFERGDPSKYIIEGYGIYKQDPACPEDMDLVVLGPFSFSLALEICEAHNGEKLLHDS